MKASIKFSEKEVKSDFILFLHYVWFMLKLPPPTPVQINIARFVSNTDDLRKICEAFRGVGKSYICYALVVWRLWNDFNLKFLIISASKSRADNFSVVCQQLLDLIPEINHLIPTDRETVYSKIKWTVKPAEVSGSPTVTSMGITSMITGSRADVILADDIESPSNSSTVDQREKLLARVREFEAIRKGDEGKGVNSEIIYLATPQVSESLYNSLDDLGLFKTRIWPAEYPELNKISDYAGKLCPILEDELHTNPDLAGTPTDPKRFSAADLAERKLMYGKAGYALQFMLDTSLSEADKFPLRTQDLLVFTPGDTKAPRQLSHGKNRHLELRGLPTIGLGGDRWYKPEYIDKEYESFESSVLVIDPSGRGKDETSYAVIKHLMGYLYIVRSGGFADGYEEETVLEPLALIAMQEKVKKVLIESNFGDGIWTKMFTPILQNFYPCTIEEVKNSVNKERRIIDTLEPIIARHRLVVTQDVIEDDYRTSYLTKEDESDKSKASYSLFYQMTHISYDKGSIPHDDRLDAVAMGVAYFTERLGRDVDMEVKALKEKAYNKILEEKYSKINKKPVHRGWVHSTKGEANILDM